MPIASQASGNYAPLLTVVPTTPRKLSLTPQPGLPPVNSLGAELEAARAVPDIPPANPRDVQFRTVVIVEPKVGSLDNVHWEPPGGYVQVFDEKPDFRKKAHSKVGSLENLHWTAPGGNVKILNQPLHFREKAKSKIGSLDNITHKPGGLHEGEFSARDYPIRNDATSLFTNDRKPIAFTRSYDNLYGESQSRSRLSSAGFRSALDIDVPAKLSKTVRSKVGSMDNINHRPGGGNKKIYDEKIPKAKFKRTSSKVGSLDNISHVPGGGDVQIIDVPVRVHAHSKVGSKDNIHHRPLGGHIVIVDEPVVYKTRAELAKAAH